MILKKDQLFRKLEWCRHHPTETFYSLIILFLHGVALALLVHNNPISLKGLEPKDKIKINTVTLEPQIFHSDTQVAEIHESRTKPIDIPKPVAKDITKKQPKKIQESKVEKKVAPKKNITKKETSKKPLPKKVEKSPPSPVNKPATERKSEEKVKQIEKQKLLDKAKASLAKISSPPVIHITSEQDFSQESDQARYSHELASWLKGELTLPEYGEVNVRLTLQKNGKVVKVEVINSLSAANQQYIQTILPKLQFPPFTPFLNEEQHAFFLTLCNDI